MHKNPIYAKKTGAILNVSGQVKQMLDQIIAEKGQGDPIMEKLIQTKLLIKGIRVEQFTESSEDDPVFIEKVRQAAQAFGVGLKV